MKKTIEQILKEEIELIHGENQKCLFSEDNRENSKTIVSLVGALIQLFTSGYIDEEKTELEESVQAQSTEFVPEDGNGICENLDLCRPSQTSL